MSGMVVKRRPEKRLDKLIWLPGGRTVEAIEADIVARMEALQGVCASAIRDKVQAIVRLAAQAPRPPRPDDLDRLYTLSNEAIGLSGVADLEDLGLAALSFCRLLDGFRSGADWSRAAFDVHLAALQLLAQPDSAMGAEARAVMVEGLHTVVKRATG
ncbi:MAG TPA: hypothetical protein VGM25_07755 [Caulobacteraceae bacterium]|jgi:hypothetical protein